jgi:hypothetical protein
VIQQTSVKVSTTARSGQFLSNRGDHKRRLEKETHKEEKPVKENKRANVQKQGRTAKERGVEREREGKLFETKPSDRESLGGGGYYKTEQKEGQLMKIVLTNHPDGKSVQGFPPLITG